MRSRKQRIRRGHRRHLHAQLLERRVLLHAEGVISGSVFFDINDDGVADSSDPNVPGVVLQLTSSDATVDRSLITDNNGNYVFDELNPGTYQISKRQMSATQGSGASAALSLTLEDDQILSGNRIAEGVLRPEFITIDWFFASAPSQSQLVRDAIALGEELAGEVDLAAAIRAGSNDVPVDINQAPVASGENYEVDENDSLNVSAALGVLANDRDDDGDPLTAEIVTPPSNGAVTLSPDGSFVYTPNTDFNGVDTFTYRANDGTAVSQTATVTITVDDSTGQNQIPVALPDAYEAQENQTLTISADLGVLANDTDADDDLLSAVVDDPPENGTLTLGADGSFSYQGDADFFGEDSFTYVANDGTASSNIATVSITVRPVDDGSPFAAVTTGSFTDANLLGTRTDLVASAPPITATHVNGDVDYSNHSNPPTYGDHHPSDPLGTDSDPGITPRPTGIYSAAQPDEDLVHNLEHGHVWISYNPNLLSQADVAALEQLVRDGAGNAEGSGVGVILTPRPADDQAIALASWAHLLTLDNYDPEVIRDFVNTNRGKAPEGFITP